MPIYCDDPNDTFWSDQLAVVKAMVPVYNAAILALATGGVKNYRLSTGQTDQSVSKLDLPELKRVRDALLNEVATLEARLCGGSTHVVPNS